MTEPVIIGDATLYHGDCREILPTLPKVGAVVTDPPYGIEGTWQGGNSHGWGKFRWDAAPWDIRPDWFEHWLSRQDGQKIIWGGQYYSLQPSGSWLVWDKLVREFSSGHCELAWTNLGKPIRAYSYSHGQLVKEGKRHPTQKPLPLMEWCLGFLPDASSILDPFMGSGTTGVACANLGRKFIGIEISERYFQIACERIDAAYRQRRLFPDEPALSRPEAALLPGM